MFIVCACVYVTKRGCMLSWVRLRVSECVWVFFPPSLSLCVCTCVCAHHVSLAGVWSAGEGEGEGEQYERGRAVLACGPGAGCCRLVAVLRWWPWSGPPSRKWWSSYTGSRGWPSPRRATRNSARYVETRSWRAESSCFSFFYFSFPNLIGFSF